MSENLTASRVHGCPPSNPKLTFRIYIYLFTLTRARFFIAPSGTGREGDRHRCGRGTRIGGLLVRTPTGKRTRNLSAVGWRSSQWSHAGQGPKFIFKKRL